MKNKKYNLNIKAFSKINGLLWEKDFRANNLRNLYNKYLDINCCECSKELCEIKLIFNDSGYFRVFTPKDFDLYMMFQQ